MIPKDLSAESREPEPEVSAAAPERLTLMNIESICKEADDAVDTDDLLRIIARVRAIAAGDR